MISARRILSPNDPPSTTANLCALTVMTKAPRAGQVKTRLTPPLTPQEAARLNICFLRDISAAISKAGHHTRGISCYTPVGSEEAYHDILPAGFRFIAQRNGDFGERLVGAIEDLLAAGFSSVCLINSDSPTAATSVFSEAARLLSSPNDKVVLGPSDDGGYYWIGMNILQPRLFERIDWSTDRVLAQTLERAGEIGLEVRFLPACYDVDDRTTLHRLCEDLLGPNDSRDPEIAPATREFLGEIVAREGRQRVWPVVSAVPVR
jgi:rSAM/selenodomain-associated transferase 1